MIGLRVDFETLVAHVMIGGTLLALDATLSSKSCSCGFNRSWTTMMEIVLIWIAIIGTHLIIGVLTFEDFLILAGRSSGYRNPCKVSAIRVECVLIVLLLHACILLFGLRFTSIIHEVIQRILVLAYRSIHYVYMIILVSWTYLWHHLTLI